MGIFEFTYAQYKGQQREDSWSLQKTQASSLLHSALWHNADLFCGGGGPPLHTGQPITLGSGPSQLLSQNSQRPLGCPANPKQASVNPKEDPRGWPKKVLTRGQQSRKNCTWIRWNQQYELILTIALQIRRQTGHRRRKAHIPARGQGLAGGQLVAVKNVQRSRFNNSESALQLLLPRSSDFYKLIIQASGEQENSAAGKPRHGPYGDSARFPSGASRWGGWAWPPFGQQGLLRMHSLAKCAPAHRKETWAIKYKCRTKLDLSILNLRSLQQARFTSCF